MLTDLCIVHCRKIIYYIINMLILYFGVCSSFGLSLLIHVHSFLSYTRGMWGVLAGHCFQCCYSLPVVCWQLQWMLAPQDGALPSGPLLYGRHGVSASWCHDIAPMVWRQFRCRTSDFIWEAGQGCFVGSDRSYKGIFRIMCTYFKVQLFPWVLDQFCNVHY